MTNVHLTCDAFQELLPDYLEGALPDSALADAELHLAACAACRSLVTDLQQISHEAAALAPLAPSRDLWPGIAARIAPRTLQLPSAGATPRRRPRWLTGALAAGLTGIAALALWQLRAPAESMPAVASAPALAAPVTADSVVPTPLSPTTPPQVTEAAPPAVSVSAPAVRAPRADATTTYANEISRLRTVFEQSSDLLDPRTRAVLSTSLRTIDSAIAEAQRALDRDPASAFLSQQLNRSLEQKLGLLRKATLLAGT